MWYDDPDYVGTLDEDDLVIFLHFWNDSVYKLICKKYSAEGHIYSFASILYFNILTVSYLLRIITYYSLVMSKYKFT